MKKYVILIAAMAAMSVAFSAQALPALYGTTHGGGSSGSASQLVEIDPTTGGIIQTVGAVGYRVNGLAWDATTNTLYGGTSYGDPNFNGLITIDLLTGAGSPIGAAYWGASSAQAVTNISVNSLGAMYGWTEWGDDLVSVDTSTGIASVVGDSGLATFEYGLAFDASDALYLFNGDDEPKSVYSLNTLTGAATSIGNVTGFNATYGEDLHHGVFDLTSGLYYGISDWGASSTNRAIYTVDMSSLTITSTLPTALDLHTLAFVDAEVIPEPATMSLVGLGLAVLTAARGRRKRRH